MRHIDHGAVVDADDRVSGDQNIGRFPQRPARQSRLRAEIRTRHENDVHVAIQCKVLKSVVQQVDRRTEVVLRESPAKVAIGPRHDDRPVELMRKHQRLVSRSRQVRPHPFPVADDDGAIGRLGPRVAAAENRRSLPHLQKDPGDRRGERCLAPPPRGDVPDADDRMAETASRVGPCGVPLAPPASDCGVDG